MLALNVVTQIIIVTQIECVGIVGTISHLDPIVLVKIIAAVMITKKITVTIIKIDLVQSDLITSDYIIVKIH